MSNINDYLVWRGDIPLDSKYIFNDVDSMILARFSYLLFDKIDLKEKETIESISNKMKNFANEDFNYNGDKELITNLGQSARFKDLIVTDYVKNNDFEAERQFSAITIHLSNEEMYISFVGTDGSITGWKEDFNMSFMENIPAQIAAKEYVENVSNKYPDKKLLLGGHSKGGNVAAYSAMFVSRDIQNRIVKVVNYDGPGFRQQTIDSIENKEIVEKIYTYIPQDSVIGRILEHAEGYEVVESVEKGIYQHDIYSWQVKRDRMIKMKNTTNASETINDTMKTWLKTTTPEKRKIFFDSIFEVFYSTSANTFSEISWIKNTPKLFETYKGLSEEDRKTITEMLKIFGKLYFASFKEHTISSRK